jgi:2-polyprenyl-3-methyl-5-hydroxy-6-metoxy-1,4-benzoquinol methylase
LNVRAQIATFERLPFCVGASASPHNPAGLPDTYPLTLEFDDELAQLRVRHTPDLERLLTQAYRLGELMGTPLADTALGIGYVDDFLSFVQAQRPVVGRALEIGAGAGFLSARLAQLGWQVDTLEPGSGYEEYWKRYGIQVIRDFFPSRAAQGPYDLIVAYAVLEHVEDQRSFLGHVAAHLSRGGMFVLAVPDCTAEIAAGDPAMLLHEHYYYFTLGALRRGLEAAGFRMATMRNAGYGRSLYAAAFVDRDAVAAAATAEELGELQGFGPRCAHYVDAVATRLDRLRADGLSLGVYCPSRALALLPQDMSLRFFDDAPELQGKFYPPFAAAVESRQALLASSTDELWIMSRTFGSRLAAALRPQLPATRIIVIDELVDVSARQ